MNMNRSRLIIFKVLNIKITTKSLTFSISSYRISSMALKTHLIVQDTAYFPCDQSVEINFTFDLFYTYEDSQKLVSIISLSKI